MSVSVSPVESRADLKRFMKLPMALYRGSPYWVPPLLRDELEVFTAGKNPAFENAEARLFLARREGAIVGRIAAILSHAANDKFGAKNLRFGWFETIDDYEVAKALFDAVEEWGRSKGLATLTGPQGFTDMDPEGLLVEGFEELATIATIYNPPFYPQFLERYGFEKEIDYVEFQATTPETGIPEKAIKMAEWAAKRNKFRIVKYKSAKETRRAREKELFDLIDESYAELYGTVPLTVAQKSYYANKYMPLLNPRLIEVVVNEKDEMIGFIVAMPSLSRAFQKARGRLLPFGLFHILRALAKFDTIDFYLAGVKKEYRSKGVDLIMVIDVFREALTMGVHRGESNPELETNRKIQSEWKVVPVRQHKKRRIYQKRIALTGSTSAR